MLALLSCFTSFARDAATPAANDDAVTSLPTFGKLSGKQYAGFAPVTADGKNKLHYWFVECECGNAPGTPLLMWLNGGPGSSSLLGLLAERLGPQSITPNATLVANPDAITKRYHLLALDNPVGSGYSYTSSGAYVTSEFEMRTQAVAALRVFFQRHPEYTSRPFWVTGESYAGHYVPNIAWEVAVNASEIPLQGVVIGNGVRRIPRLERRRQSQRLRSTSSSPPACATPSATMRADVQHGAAVPERRADGVRRGRHRRGDARGGEHAAGPVRRNDPLAPGQRRPVLRERDRLLAVPG